MTPQDCLVAWSRELEDILDMEPQEWFRDVIQALPTSTCLEWFADDWEFALTCLEGHVQAGDTVGLIEQVSTFVDVNFKTFHIGRKTEDLYLKAILDSFTP